MKYTFTGRIFPEVPWQFSVKDIVARAESGERFSLSLSCENNFVSAIVHSESEDWETLRNYVQRLIRIQLDTMSYIYARPATVFLDKVVTENALPMHLNSAHPQLAIESQFRSLHDKPDKLAGLIMSIPALQRAIVSIIEAISMNDLTGMFAFRAIESIRDHFKLNDWTTFNSTLNLHRSWAEEMTIYAQPQRHGSDKLMTATVRETLLRRAYAVTDRFIILHGKDGAEEIAKMPELFCDGKGTHSACLNESFKNHRVTNAATPSG